jgi:hypothetical protein
VASDWAVIGAAAASAARGAAGAFGLACGAATATAAVVASSAARPRADIFIYGSWATPVGARGPYCRGPY